MPSNGYLHLIRSTASVMWNMSEDDNDFLNKHAHHCNYKKILFVCVCVLINTQLENSIDCRACYENSLKRISKLVNFFKKNKQLV